MIIARNIQLLLQYLSFLLMSVPMDMQALNARRQGAALPLKDFHNDIKRRMILR